MKKTKLPCTKCGKHSPLTFTPDLDIRGLLTCKKHRTEVGMAYILIGRSAVAQNPKEEKEILNNLKAFTKNWHTPLGNWKD